MPLRSTEEQITDAIQTGVRVGINELMDGLTPKLVEMVERAYASGVSHANRKKAFQLHESHIAEAAKVELAWTLTQYGIGSYKNKKEFAVGVIRKHKLKAKLKTVQNWVSKFSSN